MQYNEKFKSPILFLSGGAGYGLIEILWRGNTHWSMVLTGGACFLLIYTVNTAPINFFTKCAVCAFAITGVEFTVGCFVNIILKLNVWDYSDLRFNFLGQVCLDYTALWFLLCIPVMLLCALISKRSVKAVKLRQ